MKLNQQLNGRVIELKNEVQPATEWQSIWTGEWSSTNNWVARWLSWRMKLNQQLSGRVIELENDAQPATDWQSDWAEE